MNKVAFLAFVLMFLSTALSLSVVGLLELQMAYASPYTNIDVGTAYNMITGGLYPDLVVLDVRTQSEYDSGHIYGAVWIPVTELEARIGELAGHENHEIIVYCGSGGRSVTASGILDSHGFTKVYNMLGGISAWQLAGYPVWIATVHNVNTTFNYDTIQATIDAPQTLGGHTIFVEAGTYFENVVMNKSLALIGEDKDTTIIDGNSIGTVVSIKVFDIEIRGFTIQNAGQTLIDCGIRVANSTGNTICNNIIRNNAYGIELFFGSNSSNIFDNMIVNNSWAGIYIHQDSSENTLHDNTVAQNSIGASIASSNAYFNTFHHNNFIDNINQASDFGSGTIWDDSYPSGGNYWNDYNGTDLYSGSHQNVTGSDGIGDITYLIDENNQDNYPLINPYGSIRNLDTNLTYLTIQSAINAPETLGGHTISVSSGIYYGHVVVNKSISLIGEKRNTTIIEGHGAHTVVHVTANNVLLKGFTIQNASYIGVSLFSSSNCTIDGNNVTVCGESGIVSSNNKNNVIVNNQITKTRFGIYLSNTSNNLVENNFVFNNTGGVEGVGIYIHTCNDSTFSSNFISSNIHGIWVHSGCKGNIIIRNDIVANSKGMLLWYANNSATIYHNNFINNLQQIDVSDSFNVTFDNGCEGNYWSNYNGTDDDGDGIGDEYLPWEGVDYYPLMSPYIEGDVNHDAIVDIFDVVIVAAAFGSRLGEDNWNCHADLIPEYGVIDIFDFVIVASHFGETW